jgi:hypothetical protein
MIDKSKIRIFIDEVKLKKEMGNEEYKSLPSYKKEEDNKAGYKSPVFRKEVAYDINSLPFFDNEASYKAAVESVIEVYNKSAIILYDGSKGHAPVFTEKELKR